MSEMINIIKELLKAFPKCEGIGVSCENTATYEDWAGHFWCDKHHEEQKDVFNEDGFGCDELRQADLIRRTQKLLVDNELKVNPINNTCNRHKDCSAAREKAIKEGRNPYIICCHDDCCDDCFGS
jgi:hypothetical protein